MASDILEGTTPGPWGVVEEETWPFGISIWGGGLEILSIGRFAYGSTDQCLDDVMIGKAFARKDRDEAVKGNAQQIANARLIALAPTLAAENARLREALERIASGAKLGTEMFSERMAGKKSLTWHAVNVLQENLAACGGTASSALSQGEAA